jgi:hypothetical protein
LGWLHFRELLLLDKPHQRDFFAKMCRVEGWSVRTRHERIQSMLYEHTALSKHPDKLVTEEIAARLLLPERYPEEMGSGLRGPVKKLTSASIISHGSQGWSASSSLL